MESNEKLQEVNINNPTCYYFDGTIKIKNFDFNNILKDEKLYKNVLVYDVSDKILFRSKPLHIRFNEVDGFIRVYDEIKYLVLFRSGKYDSIYNRIKCFMKTLPQCPNGDWSTRWGKCQIFKKFSGET